MVPIGTKWYLQNCTYVYDSHVIIKWNRKFNKKWTKNKQSTW